MATTYYSNEKSLKDTFGEAEVAGLLKDKSGQQSATRLAKAAGSAYAELNSLLYAPDYVVPEFTPYGETLDPTKPYISELIQAISDCFTAYYLSFSTDLSKKRYEDCYAKWIAYLKDADPLAGAGQIAVVARPQVFNTYLKSEREIFGGPADYPYGD